MTMTPCCKKLSQVLENNKTTTCYCHQYNWENKDQFEKDMERGIKGRKT